MNKKIILCKLSDSVFVLFTNPISEILRLSAQDLRALTSKVQESAELHSLHPLANGRGAATFNTIDRDHKAGSNLRNILHF